MDILLKRPNIWGAFASGLCLVHCIATPFLFAMSTCIGECESMAPSWWKQLDFIFLVVSFWAVYRSTKASASSFIKPAMWLTWFILCALLINEKYEGPHLPESLVFMASISLITLHLYNRKYCKCKTDSCCAN
ncbi:MerC mercury resistance protein [Flavobacteriaceae bacterium MAR_2009_75]|nr:MerC mercury resistance protein [Flavobacteriaceae bacterium MAR_2009_75]